MVSKEVTTPENKLAEITINGVKVKSLNLGHFLLLQSRVFHKIHLEWRSFKWYEKELDWICSRIHSKDPVVDPLKFNLNPIAYIDH